MVMVRVRVRVSIRVMIKVTVSSSILPYCWSAGPQSAFNPWPCCRPMSFLNFYFRNLIQPLYESRFDFVRFFTFVHGVRVLLFQK